MLANNLGAPLKQLGARPVQEQKQQGIQPWRQHLETARKSLRTCHKLAWGMLQALSPQAEVCCCLVLLLPLLLFAACMW